MISESKLHDHIFDLGGFISSNRIEGKTELVQTMRFLSAEFLNQVDEKVTEWPDSAFLEPRLFTYLINNESYSSLLIQLIYSKLHKYHLKNISAHSDEFGVISLPGIGILKTKIKNSEFVLTSNVQLDSFSLRHNNAEVEYSYIPKFLVPKTDIEVIQHVDPIITAFISKNIEDPSDLKIIENPHRYLDALSQALDIIQICSPQYYEDLIDSVRSVVLFYHPTVNSFAALGLHGMVFFNVRFHAGTTFFIDGFTHQGGHVIFNEATINRQNLFKLDPDTVIGTIIKNNDQRTIYEAIHGLYTEYMILQIMLTAEKKKILQGSEYLELLGRISFIFSRYCSDVDTVESVKNIIFSDVGLALFTHFYNYCAYLKEGRPDLSQYDLTGQKDEFDLTEFLNKNSKSFS